MFFFTSAIILTKSAVFKKKTFDMMSAPFILRAIPPYWIHHDFYGAADIKLPHTKLHCDEEVMNFTTGEMRTDGKGNLVAPWLLIKTTRCMLHNDYLDPREFNETTQEGGWFKGSASDQTNLGCLVNPRSQYVQPPPSCKAPGGGTFTSGILDCEFVSSRKNIYFISLFKNLKT